MKYDCDVIVAGGGMVGACFAAALPRLPQGDELRVILIEANPPPAFELSAEVGLRVSAVSRASRNILSAAGAWPMVSNQRLGPYREMRVWDSASDAFAPDALHFDSADIGEPDLGTVVENALMQWALLECVRDTPSVEMVTTSNLVDVTFEDESVSASLGNGRTICGRLIVGADGARSGVRELAGLESRGWGYDQKAVVAHVVTEQSHRETAWQRFLPDGPLAFLPLADGRSSIVWSTTPEHADQLLAMAADSFHDTLSKASDHVLGRITDSSPRAAFPLRLQHALRYARPRCALIGEAAHSVHPLAGQGVNLGYLDAAALAQVVAEACTDDRDPGDLPVLRVYERWRKGENLFAMATLDGLKRLFGNDNPAVGYARRAGLRLMNRALPVKHHLIRRAMGLVGDLPTLAR